MKKPEKLVPYEVYGPFEVEIDDRKVVTAKERLKEWWRKETPRGLSSRKGCYVFAMRASKGFTPIYVGKTSKQTHEKEVFNANNVANMNEVLGKRMGTLVLYLVSTKPADARSYHIDEIETWLIQQALKKNPHLVNIQKAKDWCIPGVVNGKGKPSPSAKNLAKMLGLKK